MSLLHESTEMENDDSVITMIKNDDAHSLDQWCINGGDFNSIACFPPKYPDILCHSPPIISVAAYYGSLNTFRYLSHKRANVKQLDEINIPLVAFAVSGGNKIILETMEQTGIPLIFEEEEKNALHFAAEYGKIEILKLLFDKLNYFGVNSKDKKGMTPLHYAVENLQLECVEYLLTIDDIDINVPENVLFFFKF